MVRRPTRLWAASVVAASLLTACTGHSPDSSGPSGQSTTPAAATRLAHPNARLDVAIKRIAGDVPDKRRRDIRRAIAKPIRSWVVGGFLGGDYPRGQFESAYRLWTPQAARLARRDGSYTANAVLGPELVGIAADRQRADLYVFAKGGVAGGATARVFLRMTGERRDGSLITFVVKGDLYLTRAPGNWRIFGYDLARIEEA